jgi:Ca-activated chloride channel family protein
MTRFDEKAVLVAQTVARFARRFAAPCVLVSGTVACGRPQATEAAAVQPAATELSPAPEEPTAAAPPVVTLGSAADDGELETESTSEKGRAQKTDTAPRGPTPRRGVAASPAPTAALSLRRAPSGAGDQAGEAVAGPSVRQGENYRYLPENAFAFAREEPLSTFSIDVDTASYANTRRFLNGGELPPRDAVRVEELVNYFHYDYPEPKGTEPFSTYAEVAACPWQPEHRLLHVGLKGRSFSEEQAGPLNLVFLLDVSGSMQDDDKLPLLQRSLEVLIRQLRDKDRVAVVVYAGASGLRLPSTPGSRKNEILGVLGSLTAGGSTNGGDGIQLAYHVAQENFVRGGVNRVVLATDGDFNVGTTSEGELVRLIEEKRKSGVFLSVLGFGTGNLRDATMEALANRGNGNYAYIDSIEEARKVLGREAQATLRTIAKDVKIQVEFNPRRVESYRLIGYENRALAARDFRDDQKDAGEIGAGHTVTAIYEIVPRGAASSDAGASSLRYQRGRALSAAADSGELATLSLRYKLPDQSRSQELSRSVSDGALPVSTASADFRFSAAVAAFGMLLRGSAHGGDASYDSVRALAQASLGADFEAERREFVALVDRARVLEARRR